MKLPKLLLIAILSCGAIAAGGCATTGHNQTAGEMIDDTTITTKVKSALLAEKDVNSYDIQVETFNGTVQLAGFVDSQWQIDKAAQVASAVQGVQHVKNNLIHKPK